MKFRVLILAGGKGTRMNQPFPKALTQVAGKPILKHLLDAVRISGIDPHPAIVIGFEGQKIREAIGGSVEYVEQTDQLGTGHAVMMARETLKTADAVIVLYGDHPFISTSKIRQLAQEHETKKNILTMMTVVVPSFDDWFAAFERWGRVLRDASGRVLGIREYKDATDLERAIHEVNPSFFCFDGRWLWLHLEKIGNNNAQKEYYLTDLVAMAVEEGVAISTMPIPPEEAIGINTPQEKEMAEKLIASK